MRSFLFAMVVYFVGTPALAQDNNDIIINGSFTGHDNKTYRKLDFIVPEGTKRITVDFSYDGREQKSTIDLGIIDPNGFRGWSGGNKSHFTISENDATPSYSAGAIIPGKWQLLLGVPNMRSEAVANYVAKIHFYKSDDAGRIPFSEKPLKNEAGWYRGDFHMHTAHSDASCDSLGGKRVPCPVFVTVQAAVNSGLDFISITDHNAISQFNSMREIQPYFDNLLLIPGREITSFYGHANVFGTISFVPFQIGSDEVLLANNVADVVHSLGALISINHPTAPSSEICLGCGWTASQTDYNKFDAIEIANGGSIEAQGATEGLFDDIGFWQDKLNQGYKITAIAGSDNHDAKRKVAKNPNVLFGVGYPATVIYAKELSQAEILAGIKSGRVFVDFMAKSDKPHLLDISAIAQKNSAQMGQTLNINSKTNVTLKIDYSGCEHCVPEIIENGKIITSYSSNQNQFQIGKIKFLPNNKAWIRVNMRDKAGKLMMASNPIYFTK